MNAVKRNKQGGFTLIELAIVLVIIGLILGAILKGQDLILNARGKKFINWVQTWKTLQITHLDRKGRYAGDRIETRGSGSGLYRGDGIIGNNLEVSSFLDEITNDKGFIDIPDSTIVLGNQTFYIYMGFDTSTAGTKAANAIVVTTASGTSQVLAKDEIAYMEMFDASIDGVADPGKGRVRGITAVSLVGNNSKVVSGATDLDTTGTEWSTGQQGLIYYFDRDPTI